MVQDKKAFSRREFIRTVGAAAGSLPLLGAMNCMGSEFALGRLAGRKARNVIFILSDDHRYDFMGFMGRPNFLETPSMDRMARGGAHLAQAFVTTSLCSPSRASVLTGLYSHKHGVVDNNSPVPEGTVFFPEYLQAAGYETAFIGKWHMGHGDDQPRKGFDRWVSFRGQGVYFNPTLNVDGVQVKKEGHISDVLTDYALDWLKQDRDKPAFLYLSHKAVHADFQPAKRHEGRYRDVQLEYPASMADTEANYRGKPQWVREQRNSWHGVDYMYHGQIAFDDFYRRYCETLLSVDESIGRVLDLLAEQGQLDSTLVMYMGDNGFSFGEHGLIDKRHMYEESLRVPFLAHCPELVKPGTTLPQMVQNIDVAPTVLEAAGLQAPEHMDGQSFLPLLEGQAIPWRKEIYYEYYWERNFPQTPTVHGVRTDRYKYMHYHGLWDIDELYDLQEDPDELHNLIKSPDHQDLVQELNRKVFDWLEATDGMLIPLRPDRGRQSADRRPVG